MGRRGSRRPAGLIIIAPKHRNESESPRNAPVASFLRSSSPKRSSRTHIVNTLAPICAHEDVLECIVRTRVPLKNTWQRYIRDLVHHNVTVRRRV